MATNKTGIKFRSITYPSNENIESRDMFTKNRARLERMNSVDDDCYLSEGSQPHISFLSSSNQLQIPSVNTVQNFRTGSRRQNLSFEGHLRASQFKKTHSATSPLTPSKKLLRFSDGSLGKPKSFHQNFGQAMRSTSCTPLSRKGSPFSRTSNTNLETLVDWQRPSFDKFDHNPSISQGKLQAFNSGKSKTKKLERFHPSDGQEVPSSSKSATGEPSQNTCSSIDSSGNESRSRRSQFRRAISLFSLSCDKTSEKEKKSKPQPQKILRPPTRHTYHRGFSGLPIECNSNNLEVVY